MTNRTTRSEHPDELPEEDFAAAFGGATKIEGLPVRRTEFLAWHHPVKQIVRDKQWAALVVDMLSAQTPRPKVLRYFTLPGPDLLDVRALSNVCRPMGVKIEYFGFDLRAITEGSEDVGFRQERADAVYAVTSSVLRQEKRVTDESIVYADRLEDIAEPSSPASAHLRGQDHFDVVNIDACDHLAYVPKGRMRNTFDALQVLLHHQLLRRRPWLLYITTRAEPGLLGAAGLALQTAVQTNLVDSPEFKQALAETIEAKLSTIASDLTTAWGVRDQRFLRLYCIGLGKYLLQYFDQPNVPANVELSSVYAYRVHADEPDMLAIAFKITPEDHRVVPPMGRRVLPFSSLEPIRGVRIARQAKNVRDLDHQLKTIDAVRNQAVIGTRALLEAANYDISEWVNWLESHDRRPLSREMLAAVL